MVPALAFAETCRCPAGRFPYSPEQPGGGGGSGRAGGGPRRLATGLPSSASLSAERLGPDLGLDEAALSRGRLPGTLPAAPCCPRLARLHDGYHHRFSMLKGSRF